MLSAGIRSLITACAVAGAAALVEGATAGQRGPVAVTSISVTSASSEALVVIQADGPLPAPVVGTVDAPPRIFLDFPGVVSRARGVTRGSDARIRRVRVAQHSVHPLVTRVVLDLVQHEPHRIDQSPGRLLIAVGTSGGAAAPPAPPDETHANELPVPKPAAVEPQSPSRSTSPPVAPDAQTFGDVPLVPPLPEPPPSRVARATGPPAVAARSSRPSPPLPAKDRERYQEQVRSLLDRLRMQQPLLSHMSTAAEVHSEQLQMVMTELERLAQELSTIDPPETLKAHHAMLLQAARLGVIGSSLRIEAARTGESATLRNAMSAASGAVLLLNRVCEDIRCP